MSFESLVEYKHFQSKKGGFQTPQKKKLHIKASKLVSKTEGKW